MSYTFEKIENGFIPYLGEVLACHIQLNEPGNGNNQPEAMIDMVTTLGDELFLISLMDRDSKESFYSASLDLYNNIRLFDTSNALEKLKSEIGVNHYKITPVLMLPLFSLAFDQSFQIIGGTEPGFVMRIWEVNDSSTLERTGKGDQDCSNLNVQISGMNKLFRSMGMNELEITIYYPPQKIPFHKNHVMNDIYQQMFQNRLDCYKYSPGTIINSRFTIYYDEKIQNYLVSKPIYCNDLKDLQEQLSKLRITKIDLFEIVMDDEALDEDGDPIFLREGNINDHPLQIYDITQEHFDWLLDCNESVHRNINVVEHGLSPNFNI